MTSVLLGFVCLAGCTRRLRLQPHLYALLEEAAWLGPLRCTSWSFVLQRCLALFRGAGVLQRWLLRARRRCAA